MPDPSSLPATLGLFFVTLVLLEAFWSWRNRRDVYSTKETLSNLAMVVVAQALKPIALAWNFAVLSLLLPWQLFSVGEGIGAFAITFIATDLAYYAYHRLSHERPFLWALHHTHHSSPWMNLTTAVRLNWLGKFVSPVFFAPLVLIGLSPTYVAVSLGIGLLFQFFLHTEAMGRLGWLEGKVLNTPSAHRVHHGANPQYIDKNYGGVFIVWDRLFGTYQAEEEDVRYGVTTGFLGHNPLAAQFRPLWGLLERVRSKGRVVLALLVFGAGLGGLGCGGSGSALPPPLPPEPAATAADGDDAVAGLVGTYRHVGGQADVEARDAAIELAAKKLPSFAQDKARTKLKGKAKVAEELAIASRGDAVSTRIGPEVVLSAPRSGDPVDFTPPQPEGAEARTVQLSHLVRGHKLIQTVQGERGGVRRVYVPEGDGKLTVEVTIYSERLPESVVFDLHYARDDAAE